MRVCTPSAPQPPASPLRRVAVSQAGCGPWQGAPLALAMADLCLSMPHIGVSVSRSDNLAGGLLERGQCCAGSLTAGCQGARPVVQGGQPLTFGRACLFALHLDQTDCSPALSALQQRAELVSG